MNRTQNSPKGRQEKQLSARRKHWNHMQVTDRPSPEAPSLTQAIIVQMVYSITLSIYHNINLSHYQSTVKPVQSDHPLVQSKAIFVDRWSLFAGSIHWCKTKWKGWRRTSGRGDGEQVEGVTENKWKGWQRTSGTGDGEQVEGVTENKWKGRGDGEQKRISCHKEDEDWPCRETLSCETHKKCPSNLWKALRIRTGWALFREDYCIVYLS